MRGQKFTGVAAEEADENEVCSGNRVSADSTSGCKADKPAGELEQFCLNLREQGCGFMVHDHSLNPGHTLQAGLSPL